MTVDGSYRSRTDAVHRQQLYFRVELDRFVDPPETATMSGDIFDVSNGAADPAANLLVSWIARGARVARQNPTRVLIEGPGVFDNGTGARIEAVFRISPGHVQDVLVKIHSGGNEVEYACEGRQPFYRDVVAVVDTCRSTMPWAQPEATVSTTIGAAKLTLESAWLNAGVRIALQTDGILEDMSDGEVHIWSDAELHAAMERRVSVAHGGRSWPQWAVWGLQAAHHWRRDAGVMFDAGPERSPERQGFAVFRGHKWFHGLDLAETGAQQAFLRVWVHEMGHAFNLPHAAPVQGAASWMTNIDRFDQVFGRGSFAQEFRHQFNEEELRHIRHGYLLDVVMGGNPFVESLRPVTSSPLELTVRGRNAFELMAPVRLELRLRNRSDSPAMGGPLHPDYGAVTVFIQSGTRPPVAHRPIVCRLGRNTEYLTGVNRSGREPVADRVSDIVDLTFGRDGFPFRFPGEYAVIAACDGPSGPVTSNAHVLRILPAKSDVADFEQDYFTSDVGLAYCLNGSQAPRLGPARQVLERLVARRPASLDGADLAAKLSDGVAFPFFEVQDRRLHKHWSGSPGLALERTQTPMALFARQRDKVANLSDAGLARKRAAFHALDGNPRAAVRELDELIERMADPSRGVHEPVLRMLKGLRDSYGDR